MGSRIEHCCKLHDIAYHDPETKVSRKEADLALRKCVAEAHSPVTSFVMYYAVRIFGWIAWSQYPHK